MSCAAVNTNERAEWCCKAGKAMLKNSSVRCNWIILGLVEVIAIGNQLLKWTFTFEHWSLSDKL